MTEHYGLGYVEPRKGATGIRYRAKAPTGDGSHQTLGTYDTESEATAALIKVAELSASGEISGGSTLREVGKRYLDHKEIIKQTRTVDNDRNRWANHVDRAPFIDWPVANIGAVNVADWIAKLARTPAKDKRGKRPIGPQTIRHAVNLLHGALDFARLRGLIRSNPAEGHELPKVTSEDDGWTYLLVAEQKRLYGPKIEMCDRLLYQFAIGSGIREGENYCLELQDVHVGEDEESPHAIVRWGSPGRSPKNGKIRRVELFGIALEAARAQLAFLPTWCRDKKTGRDRNALRLLWPTQRGYRRRMGKPPRNWDKHLEAAELDKPEARHDRREVRLHDLRHTCGAALASGWWGRSWSLLEIREQLGHKDMKSTQRYAHMAQSAMGEAARATTLANMPAACPSPPIPIAENPMITGRATLDSNQWPSASEASAEANNVVHLDPIRACLGHVSGDLGDLERRAREALALIEAGDRFAVRRAVEALEVAVEVCEAARASGKTATKAAKGAP